MKRACAAIAALASLAACATEPTKIVRVENASNDYVSYAYKMPSPQGELPYQVLLRPYNDGGTLIVCGYLTSQVQDGAAETRIQTWWQNADMVLNGKPIGTGHFLRVRRPGDLQASCVDTRVAWISDFQSVPLRLNAKGVDAATM